MWLVELDRMFPSGRLDTADAPACLYRLNQTQKLRLTDAVPLAELVLVPIEVARQSPDAVWRD